MVKGLLLGKKQHRMSLTNYHYRHHKIVGSKLFWANWIVLNNFVNFLMPLRDVQAFPPPTSDWWKSSSYKLNDFCGIRWEFCSHLTSRLRKNVLHRLSASLFVRLPVRLLVRLSLYVCLSLSQSLSVCLHVCLTIFLSVYVSLSFGPSVRPFVRPSVAINHDKCRMCLAPVQHDDFAESFYRMSPFPFLAFWRAFIFFPFTSVGWRSTL